MDANKTFQMIEKAFSDKRPVMVTDGTVTRRVVSVGLAEQLYIHTETGEWKEEKRLRRKWKKPEIFSGFFFVAW